MSFCRRAAHVALSLQTRRCPLAADVRIIHDGSICVAWLLTEAAHEFVEHHVESPQYWGADGLVVEPRYVQDLAAGMVDSGLEVIIGETTLRRA